MTEAILTGQIPQCPICRKPTERKQGMKSRTCMYYPPIYDKLGNNTNPDLNTETAFYTCLDCDTEYSVKGNSTQGFYYTQF